MNKEFTSLEIALALKELGFDESCMAWCDLNTPNVKLKTSHYHSGKWNYLDSAVSLPLWQQAFAFFREKFKLEGTIKSNYWNISGGIWDLNGYKDSRYDWDSNDQFSNYEEAQIDCLNNLIKIVKDNTK